MIITLADAVPKRLTLLTVKAPVTTFGRVIALFYQVPKTIARY